jgi:hypothetical protein
LAVVALLASFWGGNPALAYDPTSGPTPPPKDPAATGDEYSETPFTKFGEFTDDDEEAENTAFFQYGRFFGFSAGGGYQGVTDNRGLLWKGGFPLVTFKIHYWFSFNFALQIEFSTVPHNYNAGQSTSITMTKFGVDFRYYFDTTHASGAVTFASPFLLFGGGAFTKTEVAGSTVEQEGTFGVNLGAGLQFPISHRKIYFDLETKFIFVPFADRDSADFNVTNGIPNLQGVFYNITGSVVFTW